MGSHPTMRQVFDVLRQDEIKARRGLAFVARSVEQVEKALRGDMHAKSQFQQVSRR